MKSNSKESKLKRSRKTPRTCDLPKWKRTGRSQAKITKLDLKRLLKLTKEDHQEFLKKNPKYKALKLLSICLCQGAALHYLDGKTGIRDFDTYLFFDNNTHLRYPFRRRGFKDFGLSKFGKTHLGPRSASKEKYQKAKGRVIDIMGRQIENIDNDYQKSIQKWLSDGKSDTPQFLSEKAVVVLEPEKDLGTIIWKPSDLD